MPLTHSHHDHSPQVLKYITERVAAYDTEDPHASQGPTEVGRMIWQSLGAMVKHDGLLRVGQQKPAVRQEEGGERWSVGVVDESNCVRFFLIRALRV
jgi:hypothetical protein